MPCAPTPAIARRGAIKLTRGQVGLPAAHGVQEAARDKARAIAKSRRPTPFRAGAKKGRDALRSSEAHPQARSIARPWPQRSQRDEFPLAATAPESAETGEAHSPFRSRSSPPEAQRSSFASPNADDGENRCSERPAGFFNEEFAEKRAFVDFNLANAQYRYVARSLRVSAVGR